MAGHDEDQFDDLPILGELRSELRERLAEDSPGPQRPAAGRWLGRGVRGLPILAAVAATVAVVVVALGSGSGSRPGSPGGGSGVRGDRPPSPGGVLHSVGRMTAGRQAALNAAANRAQRWVLAHDRACSPAANRGATFLDSAPPAWLLGQLGVLRRPPAPPDRSTQILMRNGFNAGAGVYRRYIRRARTAYGKAFYIIPEARVTPFGPIPARCYRQERAALSRQLAHASGAERAAALRMQAQEQQAQRLQTGHRMGVCFAVVSLGYRGHGPGGVDEGCTPLSSRTLPLPPGGGTGEDDRTDGSIDSGIAADGIASVAFHYAAGGGHPARTLMSRVVDNVYVLRIPPGTAHRSFPTRVVVRGADGRVIPPPANRGG